jgi:hypothetical protein
VTADTSSYIRTGREGRGATCETKGEERGRVCGVRVQQVAGQGMYEGKGKVTVRAMTQ